MNSVSISELELALQFSDRMDLNTVYVSKLTGRTFIIPAELDVIDDIPEDIETSEEFVALPDRHYFDLGHELVFRFVETAMPQQYDHVRDIFHHKGAYGRFKQLLQSKNLLDRWRQFEEDETRAVLREWCEQQGLQAGE